MAHDLEITATSIANHRDEILRQLVEKIRQEIPGATMVEDPILLDTFPSLVDNLVETLLPYFPRQIVTEGSTIAQEHGMERAKLTPFQPQDVVKEYQILTEVIFRNAASQGHPSSETKALIRESLNKAMSEALTAYLLANAEFRQQFTMMLAHDLRNPLSSALTGAQMILRNPEKPEKIVKFAKGIISSLKRIDLLIQGLLDLARMAEGERVELDLQECSLQEIIEEAKQDFEFIHGDRIVCLGKDIRGIWDPKALRRVVENLLSNAIKYGDPKEKITINIKPEQGSVAISVHNKGTLISPEDQQQIFKTFTRSHSAKKSGEEGWGLGLSHVRQVAEAHGGSVVVDSSEERGTTFIVTIPLDGRISPRS